jgi:hypothetical protein
LGGDIKAHYTKGEHVYDDKSKGERLLHRVAMKKKCVQNTVTVSVGDGTKLNYAQGCCQSFIKCHETSAASEESMSLHDEDGNSYNGFLVSDFRSNRKEKYGCGRH